MEDFKKVEDLVDHVKEYVHVRVDEARLGLAERSSGAIASLIAGSIVWGIFTLAFVFVCVAGALLLGRALDDQALGFIIVASFLVLLGVIVWLGGRRWLRMPIMNSMIEELSGKIEPHNKN